MKALVAAAALLSLSGCVFAAADPLSAVLMEYFVANRALATAASVNLLI